ncbi:MAG: T9SS type A sorting domain-containing protein [Saprospiraceae bacterium]|nr:T9SS type A sorting domain-containing protein [Saprospiraceae bacterium]
MCPIGNSFRFGGCSAQCSPHNCSNVPKIASRWLLLKGTDRSLTSTSNILLKGESAIAGLVLSDVSGKTVLSRQTNDQAQSADLDLHALPNGVYLLQVRTDERTYTQKILVQK